MKPPTTYTCQQCGATAKVESGQVQRGCNHSAPIVANISAVAKGVSATAKTK